ncbi:MULTISPECIES: zinc ribbon domain-containing protein [unclassified Clostridium]|uniref:zinc ribbon domain-containing protein n=1 Tax=unclassified Clostridium TaxID=2614128 RepID=UPI001105CCD3|nr:MULTISPECIES: zinc ribbon domain-containing protein [unclassified Clostridium]
MFCAHCGKKMEDDAAKCPHCGKENKAAQAKQAAAPQQAAEKQPDQPAAASQAKGQDAPQGAAPVKPAAGGKTAFQKFMGNKLLVGGAIAALVVIIAIIVVVVLMMQPKKFNLEEYVELNYDGYDGYATAYVSIDESKLYEDILAAKGKKAEDLESLWSLSGLSSAAKEYMLLEEAVDSIDVEITSEREHLSNGDTITASITYDNEIAGQSKIQFTGETVTLAVEGLQPVTEIDPFDGLKVTFTGVAPNGKVEYAYEGGNAEVKNYRFTADKKDGLRNGDVVTISINADDENTLKAGYAFTQKEAQFTVSDLDEYVAAYADLTEDFLTKVKAEAEDTIYAYTASTYNSGSALSDLTYSGYILNAVKDGSGYVSSYNNLYLIYSGTVSNSEGKFSTSTVYFPVRFNNILKHGGALNYEENKGILGSSRLDGSSYSTKGYINPFVCYLDIVEENKEDYTAECGDGFELYAQNKAITKLSDITDAYRQTLQADALERINSYIASDYNDKTTVSDLAVAGEYLLVAKNQGTDFEKNNKYIIVYSGTVSNAEGKFGATTVYFPVEYEGVVSLPGDQFMVTETEGIAGHSKIGDSSYWTDGYVDGAEMYKAIISANRDKYTYEVSEGLKSFGE